MFERVLFGPRASPNTDHTGGVVVLFELYVSYLKSSGNEFIVVDTNSRNYKSKLVFILNLYTKLFQARSSAIVEFHSTANDIWSLFIPFQFISSSRSKVVVRKFAGNFDSWYGNQFRVVKLLVLWSMRKADLVFFETKYLINFFHDLNINSDWWPNIRRAQVELNRESRKEYTGKLLFLGQVKRSKGIVDAITCLLNLPPSFSLDIYGPLIERNHLKLIEQSQRVTYKGVLSPDKVCETMLNYDLLLFPSRHFGEGYPGVVIEAKSIGLPVVCYNHGGLSEIVRDRVDGIIVETGDIIGMTQNVRDINEEMYKFLSQESLLSFQNFDAGSIHVKINKQILSLTR